MTFEAILSFGLFEVLSDRAMILKMWDLWDFDDFEDFDVYLLERVRKMKLGRYREERPRPSDFLCTKYRSPIGPFFIQGSI